MVVQRPPVAERQARYANIQTMLHIHLNLFSHFIHSSLMIMKCYMVMVVFCLGLYTIYFKL